jgi:enoyl-CoA hydratase
VTSYELCIDRPRRGAIDAAFIDWFETQLSAAAGAPLLISGAPESFCAGIDLRFLLTLEGRSLEHFLQRLDGMFRALYEYPGPVVGLVEGHAIAGGAVLLCCCDQRVSAARDKIRIGLTEVALGACFPPSIMRICRDRVPRRFHEEVLLGAGLYSPAEALQLGLVDRVEQDAAGVARETLAQLASHPRGAYEDTKRTLREGVAEPSEEERRRFTEEALPRWAGEELRARVRGVLGR